MRSVACRSETGPPSPSLSRRASRPLPSPLSFTGVSRSCCRRDAVTQENLACKGDVRLRALAFAVELHGGSAEAWRLGEPYVARDHGLVHLLAEMLLQLRRHLLCERVTRIVHGSKQPFDIELRIQVLADLLDRVDEIGEPLERVILALHRDHHRIGCHQSVQGEYVQGRRAVEQDEFVLLGDRSECSLQAGFAVLEVTSSISAPARSRLAGIRSYPPDSDFCRAESAVANPS